jgi:hypothetical protein
MNNEYYFLYSTFQTEAKNRFPHLTRQQISWKKESEEMWKLRLDLLRSQVATSQVLGLSCCVIEGAVITTATIQGFYISRSVRMYDPELTRKRYLGRLEDMEKSFFAGELTNIRIRDPSGNFHPSVILALMDLGESYLAHVYSIAALVKTAKIVTDFDLDNCHFVPANDVFAMAIARLVEIQEEFIHLAADDEVADVLDDQLLLKIAHLEFSGKSACYNVIKNHPAMVVIKAACESLSKFKEDIPMVSLMIKTKQWKKAAKTTLYTVETELFKKVIGTDDVEDGFKFSKMLEPYKDSEENTLLDRKFEEKYHWHVLKPLSDDYDRLQESTVDANMFARNMTKYGTSIEGGMVCSDNIVVEKKRKEEKKVKKKAVGTSSAARDIIRRNVISKNEASLKELDAKLKAFDLKKYLEKANKKAADFSSDCKVNSLDPADEKIAALQRKFESIIVQEETQNCLKLFWSINLKKRDLTVKYEVNFLHALKSVIAKSEHHNSGDLITLKDRLQQLGYRAFADSVLPKIKSKSDDKEEKEVVASRSFSRFQLEHMGHLLEHERPKEWDKRVKNFNPDLWQREMFDAVDRRQSALIVAPTSSGKTYACYYAMEEVLRESDDGIVIYVAPTKALVNQVVATIYARFSKRKKMKDGKHLGRNSPKLLKKKKLLQFYLYLSSLSTPSMFSSCWQ